jgi:hypothetical protein
VGRTIAPLIATSVYALAGTTTPFIAGGILVVLAGVLTFPAVSTIYKPEPAEAAAQESKREMPADARDRQGDLWAGKK